MDTFEPFNAAGVLGKDVHLWPTDQVEKMRFSRLLGWG